MPLTTPDELQAIYGHGANHFLDVLEHLFEPAIDQAGFDCIRPISDGSEIIHADIIRNLIEADLVLCDCSILNANVFFELGIRTAMNKPVCVVKDDKTPKVPFDIGGVNHHTYNSSLTLMTGKGEQKALADHISKSLERSKGKNSLWSHFGLKLGGDSPSPPQGQEDRLALILQTVESIAGRVDEKHAHRPSVFDGIRTPDDVRAVVALIEKEAYKMSITIKTMDFIGDSAFVVVDPNTSESQKKRFEAILAVVLRAKAIVTS